MDLTKAQCFGTDSSAWKRIWFYPRITKLVFSILGAALARGSSNGSFRKQTRRKVAIDASAVPLRLL